MHGSHEHQVHGHAAGLGDSGHGHGGQHHADRGFGLAMGVNLAYTLFEAVIGWHANSLTLLSDALHNFGDALGLALAWGATVLARRRPTDRHTYGWRRATHLSPLANALLLVGFSGALVGEALRRFSELPDVPGKTVMLVAALGILVNLGSAALFYRGQAGDLNQRGAYLHLLSDAAVSVAAVLAGWGMLRFGWRWLDPALAVLVALVVAASAWGLLRASLAQVMDAVPAGIDLHAVESFLLAVPGVEAVHHLHIWSIGTGEIALTAHIVRRDPQAADAFLAQVSAALDARFGINHATLQVETGQPCLQPGELRGGGAPRRGDGAGHR